MKNNLFIIIAFVLVCLGQIYVPAKMIVDQENVLKTGVEYKFKTAPVDPNDPFRGKYVTLRYDQTEFTLQDTTTDWYSLKEVYVQVTADETGFAKIVDVSSNRFDGDVDYFKAWLNSTYVSDGQTTITVNYPFDRYYMEEFKAPDAEEAYAEAQWDTSSVAYALVRIKGGTAVLKDVMIDGVSLKDYVQQSVE